MTCSDQNVTPLYPTVGMTTIDSASSDDLSLFLVDLLMTEVPGRAYARDKRRAFNKLVSEVYSPARVTEQARKHPEYGLLPGFALDLTTADEQGVSWDFDVPARRAAALELVRRTKPLFLIGSPMCTCLLYTSDAADE